MEAMTGMTSVFYLWHATAVLYIHITTHNTVKCTAICEKGSDFSGLIEVLQSVKEERNIQHAIK
jgi:hypothetical protein